MRTLFRRMASTDNRIHFEPEQHKTDYSAHQFGFLAKPLPRSTKELMSAVSQHNKEEGEKAKAKAKKGKEEKGEEGEKNKSTYSPTGVCVLCGVTFSKFSQHMVSRHPFSESFWKEAEKDGHTPETAFIIPEIRRKTPLRIFYHRVIQTLGGFERARLALPPTYLNQIALDELAMQHETTMQARAVGGDTPAQAPEGRKKAVGRPPGRKSSTHSGEKRKAAEAAGEPSHSAHEGGAVGQAEHRELDAHEQSGAMDTSGEDGSESEREVPSYQSEMEEPEKPKGRPKKRARKVDMASDAVSAEQAAAGVDGAENDAGRAPARKKPGPKKRTPGEPPRPVGRPKKARLDLLTAHDSVVDGGKGKGKAKAVLHNGGGAAEPGRSLSIPGLDVVVSSSSSSESGTLSGGGEIVRDHLWALSREREHAPFEGLPLSRSLLSIVTVNDLIQLAEQFSKHCPHAWWRIEPASERVPLPLTFHWTGRMGH